MPRAINLNVNGKALAATVSDSARLLDVLRRDFNIFGVREGCGVGVCGSCSVLLDGEPVSACLTLAALCDGKSITTVEGLESEGHLSPIQEAFLHEGAYQCGYCTSGMLVMAHALFQEEQQLSREQVVEYMEGNLCRCGSYPAIISAILQAASHNNRSKEE